MSKLPPLKSPKKSIAVSGHSTNTHKLRIDSQKSSSSTVVQEVKVTLETETKT